MEDDEMPTLMSLTQAVSNALAPVSPSVQVPSNVNRAYESYTFSVILETLVALGYSPSAEQLQAGVFRFPKGRNHVTAKSYSFARFTRNTGMGRDIELHQSLYAIGSSGNEHEMDVGLIDRGDAERARDQTRPLNQRAIWAVVESKCYTPSGQGLGVGIGRNFLGLANELGGGRKYFALMTSYPWRDAAFEVLSTHRHKYFISSPDLATDEQETKTSLLNDLRHHFRG